jgi:hypothetical protein
MSSATDSTILDAHTRANLEPEELAAIEAGREDAEAEALRAIAAGAPDDDDDDDAPAGAAPIEGKGAAPDASEADAPAVSSPAQEPAGQPREAGTVYRAPLPADFDQRAQSIKEASEALREKFKAGDIDVDEYAAERDKLDEQRDEINRLRVKAEIAGEIEAQSAQAQWQASIAALFDRASKDGIDYRADEAARIDLDMIVKALAQRAGNDDKPMQWFLDEAHRRVLALHDKIGARAAPAPAAAAAPARREPPVAAIPASLAGVPGGDGPGDVGDEFADIDALEGEAFEEAVRRMAPERRERYMRAA